MPLASPASRPPLLPHSRGDAPDPAPAGREAAGAEGRMKARRPPPWLLPGLVSGILLTFAYPPLDLGPLAWVAPLPLFAYILSSAPRPGVAAYAAGLVFSLGLLSWMRGFAVEASLGASPICAGFWAVAACLARRVGRRCPSALGPWVLAAAWTAMEWARVAQPIPFCWGDLNQSQHRALAVLQILDLTGPYGLSFLMAA